MARIDSKLDAKEIFDKNRFINGGPMWSIIKQRVLKTPETRHAYNSIHGRNPYGNVWVTTYERLAEVLELINLPVRDLYAQIGIEKLLSDEDKAFLDELETCEDYQLEFLWDRETILNDRWYQRYTGPDYMTPGSRLLDYLRTFNEGPLFKCSSFSRQYTGVRDTIPKEHLADFYLGAIRRLMKVTVPTEIIPEIAEKTDLSVRWLICWQEDKSFYGYDPFCEMIYDSYKLCLPDKRALLRAIVHQFAVSKKSAKEEDRRDDNT